LTNSADRGKLGDIYPAEWFVKDIAISCPVRLGIEEKSTKKCSIILIII